MDQVQQEEQILGKKLRRKDIPNFDADSTPAGSEVTPMDCTASIHFQVVKQLRILMLNLNEGRMLRHAWQLKCAFP